MIVLAVATAALMQAEEGPGANAIVMEPLAVVFAKTFVLEYERRVTPGVSLALAPAVSYGEAQGSAAEGETPKSGQHWAVGATLAMRLYPWSRAPGGAFIGPFGGLAWAWTDIDPATDTKGFGWSVGGLAGYTFILGKSFACSLGLGASWNDQTLDGAGETSGDSGLRLATRLAIGWVF